MKSLSTCAIILVTILHCQAEDDDPFAGDAQPAPPRPERKIEKLPSSVSHNAANEGAHSYTVVGIYGTSKGDDDIDAAFYEAFVPDCTSFTLDFKKHTCTFITSRQLPLSELAYTLDDLARLGGDLPSWLELEARDIEVSEAFHTSQYKVDAFDEEFPAGLAWFWLSQQKEFRIPFKWTRFGQGELLIVPHTAHCMAHSRFTIRVLDQDGKLVWQDNSTVLATVRLAVADTDQDGAHEIYIDRDDHGRKSRFHIKQASEQGGGGKGVQRR